MRVFQRFFEYCILGAVVGTACVAGGCSSVKECAGTSAEGNIGSIVNSPYDDFAPVFYGANQLLFTSNREGGTSQVFRDSVANFGEDIYTSEFLQGMFSAPELVHTPPLNTYANDGSASFFYDAARKRVEMYFASFSHGGSNADIYMCEFVQGQWSEPTLAIGGINSESWDAHPAIAPDGKTLVFASDRPGGRGGVDLYASKRRADGVWNAPINLGETINSRFDEITPILTSDNALLYATKAFSASRTFDIVMADYNGTLWGTPRALSFPINTQFDEISPAMWGDSVIYASNRTGGCGGYDLYASRLCNDVIVRGQVLSPERMAPYDFIVVEEEENGTPLFTVPVVDKAFEVHVPARKKLTLRYVNSCYSGKPLEQVIETPCSVDPVLVKVRFEIPDKSVRLTFDSYEIPFFVSGYYRPNTTENLEDLRLRFAYNLFGATDSTRYIEFPDESYTAFAAQVDAAMAEAVTAIEHEYGVFNGLCSDGGTMLQVTVEGFADPRNFTPVARYAGVTIDDAQQGVYAEAGMPMSNELLSTLRAYYSMLTLREMLERNPSYQQYRDRIRFAVRGNGIAESDMPYERQRKIVVTITPVYP